MDTYIMTSDTMEAVPLVAEREQEIRQNTKEATWQGP